MIFKKNKLKFISKALHKTHEYGDFDIHVFHNDKGDEIAVLTKGNITKAKNILCRVASECVPGIVLNSSSCECKEQLDIAMEMIAKEKQGILIYLRQEGRGQGLGVKIQALNNKHKGLDTFAAVEALGKKADTREYDEAVKILKFFEVESVKLITNNQEKVDNLEKMDISVTERVNVEVVPTEDTYIHLKAKKQRGHYISYDFELE